MLLLQQAFFACRRSCFRTLFRSALSVCAVLAAVPLAAAEVPIGGFLPFAGLSLTDEFKGDNSFEISWLAEDESTLVGSQLGSGGTTFYDLALLDTGASVSLITEAADAAFGVGESFAGEPDGFRGTVLQRIGGATGFLDAFINDPLATFVTGTSNRQSGPGGSLAFDTNSFVGQSSVSILTLPAESDLPNVIGIPLLSRYATYIHSDQPQIFEQEGRTVRTPDISFHTRGTGDTLGIQRRVPVTLAPAEGFSQQPLYIFNFDNILGGGGDPLYENPQTPTVMAPSGGGALFVSVDVENEGEQLNNFSFFFDTGADVTVVSELNAARLGFDVVLDEPEFTVAVVGSGGTNLEVPGFFVENFTIEAIGGNITAHNVPVIVLDIVNPANPGNVVDGIVGTNLLAGRNVVIDPNPSLGGGGDGPSLFVSDPVTTEYNWSAGSEFGDWHIGSNWDQPSAPDELGIANVRYVAGEGQHVVVGTNTQVWEVNVEGGESLNEEMTLAVANGVELVTFGGMNVRQNATVQLVDGRIDTQYIDLRDGTLTGSGEIFTGSGPIPGQVENRGGRVAPTGTLTIDGRYAQNPDATVSFGLDSAGHDELIVFGDVALAGTLEFILYGSAPELSPGDSFELISASGNVGGTFDNLLLPSEYSWDVTYGSDSVLLSVLSLGLAGDYNGDGHVDVADYTVWLDSLGSMTNLEADGDNSGTVDMGDYAIWKGNFGATSGAGSSVPLPANVPEPTSLLLGLIVLLFGAGGRNWRP